MIYEKLTAFLNSVEYKDCCNLEAVWMKKHQRFLDKFNLLNIEKMDKKNYVLGLEETKRNSFCYWVETELKAFGSISGRTTAYQKFVLYFDAKNNKYSFGDSRITNRKGFGSNVDEIYDNVKKEIIRIYYATMNHNYDVIIESPLNPQFKNKLSCLYDINNQIPIYSDDDLSIILSLLEIPFDIREDRFFKRKKLFDFYVDNEINKVMSTLIFMRFLYSPYGFEAYLRGENRIKVDKSKNYILLDVEVEDILNIKTNKKSGKYVYNHISEQQKILTGKKGETIVLDYLMANQKALGISNIQAFCNIDDSKGYDISYQTNNGETIMIEVKSTKHDLKNGIHFEMSGNELSVMKNNPNNYYIYFINDVYNSNVIKRIKASHLIGLEKPTKYVFHLKEYNSNTD